MNEQNLNEKQKVNWLREIIPYVVILGVVLMLRIFVIVNAYIPSESMESTIMTGSRVLGLKSAYWFSEPERGDIAVFWAPDEPDTLYVKRVIGLPGDTVEIKSVTYTDEDGDEGIKAVVYVNGEELQEDYLNEEMEPEDAGPYVVPEDCYFMLGDNRNYSLDARYWTNTYVSKDAIVGKVYLEYWKTPQWLASTPDYE